MLSPRLFSAACCLIGLSLCAWGQQSSESESLARPIADINQALVAATTTSQPANAAWVGMLLQERAKLLASLIETDPARAVAAVLPSGVADKLRSIAPDVELESQGEWEGVLEAIVADDFERHRSRTHWALRTERQKFEVYLADAVKPHAGASVKLRGISVAGRIAAASLTTVADTTVAAAPRQCSTLGQQNVAVLMVTTPSNPAFPSAFTPASVQQAFFGSASDTLTTDSVNGMWREMSYGQTSAAGNVYGPFSLSQNYTCDQYTALAAAAIGAADATVDFTQFTRIGILFPVPSCSTYAGMDTIGCITFSSPSQRRLIASEGWFPIVPAQPAPSVGLYAHELGHGLGLDHSSTDDYNSVSLGPIDTPGTLVDYGDQFSVMGYPYNSAGLAGQYTAEHKSLILHWLKPGDYREVSSSGTFTLAPYESASGLRALRVLRDGSTGAWVWLEYRQPIGDIDSNLRNLSGTNVLNGALIHYEDPTLDHAHTYLLDFTPVSVPNNFLDAALAVGRTWFDPYSPLTLTVNSATPSGLSVTVNYTNKVVTPPVLNIAKVHSGAFTQGQSGATYTVTVSNNSSAGPTSGTVTVTEALPPGLSLASLSGTGWSCASNICSRSDALNGGASYPAITVRVNVAAGAASPQVNMVSVSGGGSVTASATDSTIITARSTVPPFGVVDTPANGATGLAGAINFTGWALSLNTISTVSLCREPVAGEGNTLDPHCLVSASPAGLVYLGNAVLVPGVRPDVASSYPGYPNNNWGWGAQILTNYLPGTGRQTLGNGTYKLHAIAADPAGLSTDLGATTISVDNAASILPFGTIDTPAQGQTVSGTNFINFGWVVTPQPNIVPIDGSTITVRIDGVPVGHPTYNQFRSDIATLFPGLMNSNGAVGFFPINTTLLSNGIHNIDWVLTDSAGHGAGIGSRNFFVQN